MQIPCSHDTAAAIPAGVFCRGWFAACAIILACAAGSVHAQPAGAYPTKPIRLIVPFPPGGSNDIVGRYVANQLSERLGKQVVVDNRGGAGGLIGSETAANSIPDGHTLLLISVAYSMNASIYKLPYDSVKSFSRVAQLGTGPAALAIYPGLPVNSVKELIALAKAKPNTVVYATAGIGSFQHFASELFRTSAGLSMVHVPYKGGGPALIDTVAGQVPVYFAGVTTGLSNVQAGRLRALAVTGSTRSKPLPDVPMVGETPGLKGYEASVTYAAWTPAKTSPEIINRLNATIIKAMQAPEFRARLDREGCSDPIGGTPEMLAAAQRSEIEKLAKIVKAAGIEPQ